MNFAEAVIRRIAALEHNQQALIQKLGQLHDMLMTHQHAPAGQAPASPQGAVDDNAIGFNDEEINLDNAQGWAP